MATGASADLKAKVDLLPTRSQVVLVACASLAGLAMVMACWLFAHDKPEGYVFVALTVALAAGVLWAWTKSQPDIDLDQAHPTSFAFPDGTTVSTDSRMLRTLDDPNALLSLLSGLIHRKPLPEASGTVGDDMTVLPNSKGQAQAVVARVNDEVKAATEDAITQLRTHASRVDSLKNPAAVQPSAPEIG